MPLECPVCLEAYNLEDKKPKTLQCIHSVCDKCLTTLTGDTLDHADSVECPTCRRASSTKDININYGLLEALAEKCPACFKQLPSQKCHHCDKELCESCLDGHGALYYTEIKEEMNNLRDEILQAIKISTDQCVIERELKQEEEIIQQIKQAHQNQVQELDRMERELGCEVQKISDSNVNKHREWSSSLDTLIDSSRAQMRISQGKLGKKYTRDNSTELLVGIHNEIKDCATELRHLRTNLPSSTEYRFDAADAINSVIGDIVCHPKRTVDYKHVTNTAIAGSEGERPNQFMDRARVTCTDDRVIVADVDGHAVKVYTSLLEFEFMLGEKGNDKYQFLHPNGICHINGEIFVVDQKNNRIKVFTKNFRLSKMFGSEGSGRDEFDRPLGLAASPDGELYVCDSNNYRVKVLKPDGKFVRAIGVKGDRPGEFQYPPHRIAITSNGGVFIIDEDYFNVHTFNNKGQYTGLLITTVPDTMNRLVLRSIAVGKNDTIILADRNNHRLIVMSTEGDFICTIGTPGTEAGQLQSPWDIAVNNRGDIVVYEKGNHRLQLYEVGQYDTSA